MKQVIGLFLALAMICCLLCACTSPQPDETEQTGANSLPVPSAANGHESVEANTQTPDGTSGQTNANAAPDDTGYTQSLESNDPASQSAPSEAAEPEPEELETVSEYVVDGGNGFGFGGN